MDNIISPKFHNKEILLFVALFIITVISVYYLPQQINQIFFLILLITIWTTKKDYFWLTFFIIILAAPMRLFENYSGEAVHRIPQYNIIGKYGLTFNEIFLILFTIKAVFRGKKNKLLLKNQYLLLLALIIFLWALTFIYGIRSQNFIAYARGMLYFTLFYSVPRLIKNEEFLFFYKIFIVFTILTLVNQILGAIIGFNISDKITGTDWIKIFFADTKYLRAGDSVLPQFFVFIFGMVYLSMNKHPFSSNFLYLMVFLSYLSIFMTGTRGWIIALSIALIYYLIFIEKQKSKIALISTWSLLILVLIVPLIPTLQNLLLSNIARLDTIKYLAEGDPTAGGTLLRLTMRMPHVINGIAKNPILGWGFSNVFEEFRDGHVGWANLILQVGIMGLLMFIIFWISFWTKNSNLSKKLSQQNIYKKSLLAINMGLLSLLIIHSTSRTMFNITMLPTMLVLVIMYFLFSDMWAKKAIYYDKYMLDQSKN